MLDNKFKHHAFFKGKDMTVKQFLDYVVHNSGDWIIEVRQTMNEVELFSDYSPSYYLSDGRYGYKLGYQERNYLALSNDYFESKLPPVDRGYMMVVMTIGGEPIEHAYDVIYARK